MSVLDKVIAAVTPPESEEARIKAREKAMQVATPGDWLSQILDHHRQIEALFAAVKAATTADARRAAQKKLGTILTGHSIAEEAAIYPALAADKQVTHAELAYQEQSAAKMEMGLLERLDPLSEDYLDKLGHIEGAVAHHVYSEEGTWFLELAKDLSPADQAMVTRRYSEEFDRYMGTDKA
jgi:hemerythrin superfamily protein